MTTHWELAYTLRLPEPCILLHEAQKMPEPELRRYRAHLAGMILNEIDHQPPAMPLIRARVHVKRYCFTLLTPSYVNLHGGLKQLTDVLCGPRLRRPYGLGFIVDDSPQFLDRLTIQAMDAPLGKGYTIIQIFKPRQMARAA